MASLTNASFRRRPRKNPISDPNAVTLDSKHKEKLAYFEELRNSIPERKEEVESLKKEYQKLLIANPSELSSDEHSRKADLPKIIQNCLNKISSIERNDEEVEYIAKTNKIISAYYQDNNKIQPSKSHKSKRPKKSHSNSAFDDFLELGDDINRGELLNEYLSVTDRTYTPKVKHTNEPFWKCKACNGENLVVIQAEAIVVCEDCGIVSEDLHLALDYTPTYKEMQDIDRQPQFAYKKINHFHEHLQNMQAEENTQIPEAVIDAVKLEMKKEKIKPEKLTENKVRGFLKKHGLNKYYEHIYHIICLMNGNPPLKMEPELREQLCVMFNEIQEPFTKHCPPERKNFLSYKYVLHKFCQLLSRDEYLKYFPLLKSREKLYQQDLIWRGICDDLLWEYIPSV